MIQNLWKFLLDEQNREALKVVGPFVAALGIAGWVVYKHFSKCPSPENVTINADEIARELIQIYKKQLSASDEREQTFQVRERFYQRQIKALTEVIQAIPQQTEILDASARIDEALKAIAKGETAAAESIFQEVLDRKAAEGRASTETSLYQRLRTPNQEAAAAARHLGALVFLHNTEKALQVYGRAVSLDPENPDGWNQLGHLRMLIGDLSGAEEAYRKILNRGKTLDDQDWQAAASANLGNVYQIRGDLDRAEEMYRKSLTLFTALGNPQMITKVQGLLDDLASKKKE